MSIKKLPGGRWRADFNKRLAPRKRKTFDRRADAQAWLTEQNALYHDNPAALAARRDTRPLTVLCDAWFTLYGHALKTGRDRLHALKRTCRALGDPPAHRFNGSHFAQYRARRAERVSLNTLNHEHAHLRAMFNKLIELREYRGRNPLEGVKQYKIEPTELAWLRPGEIETLRQELAQGVNRHALPVALVCLATGARWGEAESLRPSQIAAGLITFHRTKGNLPRSVPVAPEFAAYLLGFARGSGPMFDSCYAAFGGALKRAGIDLPRGQRSHVLRHTFASHFMQQGGNIRVLQSLLGHKTLDMTMKYAHFAPEHLHQAIAFNPLAGSRHFVDTDGGAGQSMPRKEGDNSIVVQSVRWLPNLDSNQEPSD